MDQGQMDHLKGALEALLFVSEKPVTLDQLKDALQAAHIADVREAVKALMADYETLKKGVVIVEIANGFQMLSAPNYSGYIREFYKTRQKEKLSRPALETLAIIAYKQPVSRTDVEVIRGVNSDGVVMHLLNKALIKIVGRKEVPGRPYVYGTTTQFLEYFGLRSLEDLPKLEEFPALMAQNNEAFATVNPDVSVVADNAQEPVAEAAVLQDVTPVSQEEVAEALAQARMRADIEEIEKKTDAEDGTADPSALGESSGQSRVIEEDLKQETDHGPEQITPEN